MFHPPHSQDMRVLKLLKQMILPLQLAEQHSLIRMRGPDGFENQALSVLVGTIDTMMFCLKHQGSLIGRGRLHWRKIPCKSGCSFFYHLIFTSLRPFPRPITYSPKFWPWRVRFVKIAGTPKIICEQSNSSSANNTVECVTCSIQKCWLPSYLTCIVLLGCQTTCTICPTGSVLISTPAQMATHPESAFSLFV